MLVGNPAGKAHAVRHDACRTACRRWNEHDRRRSVEGAARIAPRVEAEVEACSDDVHTLPHIDAVGPGYLHPVETGRIPMHPIRPPIRGALPGSTLKRNDT